MGLIILCTLQKLFTDWSNLNDCRRILEEKKVSLENVIVRESESIVVGTVKVRNLSFDKEVVVRVTYDKWKTQASAGWPI